jgi:hypothetical protein
MSCSINNRATKYCLNLFFSFRLFQFDEQNTLRLIYSYTMSIICAGIFDGSSKFPFMSSPYNLRPSPSSPRCAILLLSYSLRQHSRTVSPIFRYLSNCSSIVKLYHARRRCCRNYVYHAFQLRMVN